MASAADETFADRLRRVALGRTLEACLERDANNYDLLRLILALVVIYGHTPAIYPGRPWKDLVSLALGFNYSGGLAVIVFFVLSGLFVTESMRRYAALPSFAARRILRIYPALLACLLFLAFVLGPAVTAGSAADYLLRPQTVSYVWKNLLLTDMQWSIPGVFDGSAHGLNGSLWTLPTEIRLYCCVAVVFLLGSYGAALSANIATALVMALFLNGLLPGWRVSGEGVGIAVMFFFGSALSINKKHVPMSWPVGVALATALPLLKSTVLYETACYALVSYWLLYLFTLRPLRRLVLPGDYSYGVYLYGFPMQLLMAAVFPGASPAMGTTAAAAASIVLGAASWHLVERPCSSLGHRLASWLDAHPPLASVVPRLGRATRPLALVVAAAAVVALAGLRVGGAPRPGPSATNLAQTAASLSDLRIIAHGPDDIRHGEGFNTQPNGDSAIWVRVSRAVAPGTRLRLSGRDLMTTVAGDLLTAPVPPDLYAASGAFPLVVVEQKAGVDASSPPAALVVR